MSHEDLWERWRWLDAIVWQGAATEDAAFEAWYEAHRQLVEHHKPEDRRAQARLLYTNSQDIKDFYKTVTGQRLLAIYVFNTRLLSFLQRPDRVIRRWLWFLSWNYRRFLVDIGYAQSTLESELDRARRREQFRRERDTAARRELEDWFNAPPPELDADLFPYGEVIEADFQQQQEAENV